MLSCELISTERSKFPELEPLPQRQVWSGLEKEKASMLKSPCPGKVSSQDQLGPCTSWVQEKERGWAPTLFQQTLHLGTRTVIMDDHVETQILEALEKGLGIFVCSVPDAHTCGHQAPSTMSNSWLSTVRWYHPVRSQVQLRATSQLQSRPNGSPRFSALCSRSHIS